MRLSLAQPADSAAGLTALHFAAALDRRSDGRLKIEVYPNGQLAKQEEAVEGLRNGVVDFAMYASAVFSALVPKYQVFDLPFLFKDAAAASRVLDGPIGAEFFAELEPKGIVGISAGSGSFKEFETTSKAVIVPEDMKGLRMRIQGGAVFVAMYRAFGAIPVNIDLSETVTALSQHTIDGMDITLDGFTTQKYYTIVKHIAMSNQVYPIIPLLGSKRKIEALPAALQSILKQEGRGLAPFWRSLVARQTEAEIQMLKANGVSFSEIKYSAFRKAMEPVYAQFQSTFGGDLIERISRVAGG